MSYSQIIDEVDLESFIDNFVLQETQETAIYVDQQLVSQTPKDTSQAARSWNVSLVNADNSKVVHGTTASAVSNAENKIKSAQPYKLIFIQNMQPYIGRLNAGWSLQAPSGYIDNIILEAANR